jgi:ABC-2 type transport system ATP-binding protein
MTNGTIRTENLSKQFQKVEALRNLNLTVPDGAVYALIGPNGAGKTTAIKILMNIFGATSGRAEVLGIDSARLRGRLLSSIGYVSENQELPDWMRVGVFFAYLRPFYPTWDRDLERDLVRQFDLPLDRKLRDLSRGMRVKAALASSLAYHPKLIVLDEPFTGLDPLVRDELIQGLLDRAEESTILISSHDLAEVETFASHVGYLEKGQLRFSEELTSLVDHFREVELTFETPPALPKAAPETWLQLSASAAVVRFIESRFDPEKTNQQIRSVLGETRDVTFTPMSLRSIFLAMAKAGRELAEATSEGSTTSVARTSNGAETSGIDGAGAKS